MKDYKVDKAKFSASFCQEVHQVVCDIPVGKVSTYGEIATLLGMPQCSRMVGRALKQVPEGISVPCHRVVNASGRLVPGWTEQKQLLLKEGISFKQNGCVDLKNIFGITLLLNKICIFNLFPLSLCQQYARTDCYLFMKILFFTVH